MLSQKLQISKSAGAFNMTPIVDIVFLLIIFFMLVCQFIVAENFQVDVPENIANAQKNQQAKEMITTVTVTRDKSENIIFAVGSEKILARNPDIISQRIANAINAQLKQIKQQKRIVSLRINKDITYQHSQLALAGISDSIATDIQLAVINN